MESPEIDMSKLWRAIANTMFWSYERGSWPYDALVIGIVLFVLFSPRAWFNDRPVVALGPQESRVEVVSEDAAARTKVFRLNANLLAQPKPDPAFERKAHDFLSKNVEELKGKSFQIREIHAVREPDGTVLYYEIAVKH
jgi:hypothetical protein